MTKPTSTLPAAELLVACSVVFATTGQLVIKLGLRPGASLWTKTPLPFHIPLTLGLMGGLAIYGLGTLLWILAVSRKEISYLYPLASANYVLAALSGHLILNEPLMPGRWFGIFIMVAGIVLLTYSPPKQQESKQQELACS
jgi:drug/metabolite transporter (DMT)-like permease